ncbi:type IV secretion system DNA-binding domain-containing protein [Patescibacteria group bacterium]|nr:type IV secretion system DNA-binding domain-containing protein [Patescibacteria group bacterium]
MPVIYPNGHEHEREITLFGQVNFRNTGKRFGIRTDDRRRHMYIIGKTGMGKTTLMENMFMSDVYAGHGCCYIDPHGDTAEKFIDFIPSDRINDVVYFNPADTAFPFGFNILETPSDDRKHLVRDGLMGVFKKIWPDVWSARMEYILQNCVSALLDYPGATLMGINRLLVDKEYREKIIDKIQDPVVKTFWVAEFTSWSEKYATEAIAPVQNKVGQFLSSSIIRNIVAQVRSTIDIRRIMDEGKILIVNLSKGRVGEDGMRLLGGMIVTKIQLCAQERQNVSEQERRDFYLYVDEFQNFANESFATILSEARKYRLNLVVAHQYMEQLDEKVQAAVLGNVGTMIAMRVGPTDAEMLETEFAPTFTPEDLVNLAKFQMYLKLMVDGVSTQPFSANTLPPIAQRTQSEEKVLKVSRERYAEPRHVIEQKILKWAGMEMMHTATPSASKPVVTSSEAVTGEGAAVAYPAIQTEEELEARIDTTERVSTAAPKLVIRPERLAAIQEANKANREAEKMRKKPSFKHVCGRCGKEFALAVQLDPSKPIYDPECREILRLERVAREQKAAEAPKASSSPTTARFATREPREDRDARDASRSNASSRSGQDRDRDRSRGDRSSSRRDTSTPVASAPVRLQIPPIEVPRPEKTPDPVPSTPPASSSAPTASQEPVIEAMPTASRVIQPGETIQF